MWKFKVTGNMTLSVLDESNFQIIKVDILSQGLMKAGKMGEDLIEAKNNLSVIAHFPQILSGEIHYIDFNKIIPHPDVGISNLPWCMTYSEDKKILIIRDEKNKKIAGRTFPSIIDSSKIDKILEIIRKGIKTINTVIQH